MASTEEKREFADVVHPQQQDQAFTVRISTKSKMTAFLKDFFVHPNKPVLMYWEEWCDYHSGWHISLTKIGEAPAKCHENELLKAGQIQKPAKSGTHFEF